MFKNFLRPKETGIVILVILGFAAAFHIVKFAAKLFGS